MTALLLPYELIDVILKMASKHTDIYYLQLDHNTGKLIYKHNMKCQKLKIIKQTQFSQYAQFCRAQFARNTLNDIYKQLISIIFAQNKI